MHSVSGTNLFGRVGEEVDALGNDDGEPSGGRHSARLQKGLPRAIVLALPPPVRPANNNGVRFHASQAARLDSSGRAEGKGREREGRPPLMIHR